jgi:hypothetical protein
MAIGTLNGEALIACDFVQARWGLWHADVLLQGEIAPGEGAAVTLTLGTVERSGTVINAGQPYGQARCRIVGGKGKLQCALLTPSDYSQVGLDVIARDILTQAGETPGSNLTPLASTVVEQWQLCQETAWEALQRVFRARPDLDLWCERNGSLSARSVTWTQTISTEDVRGLKPQERQLVLMIDDSNIEPGVVVSTVYGDFRCERVQYELDPGDTRSSLTARMWYPKT